MIRKQPNINYGAAILFVIFCLLFFVLVYRFVSIQATGEAAGKVLAAKAEKKYLQQNKIEAKRGTIYDRNGEVIAEDTSSFRLIAILDKKMTTNPKKPQHVVDPQETAEKLSKYIEMDQSDIYNRLKKKEAFQVEFGSAGKDLSTETMKKIEALKLPGITFIREAKRYYPNGVFASHLVGYVDNQEEDRPKTKVSGKLGIEQELNKELTGKDGTVQFEKDLWGYILPDSKEKIKPAQNGDKVFLTIDKKIQTFLEDSLNKAAKEYSPAKMIAIVADPKTGAILAMAQRPTFDPDTKKGINQTWHNLAIEDSYEPGSTMKVFTLAAAVNEGVFNPTETYQSGSYQVTKNSKSIHDHNYVGWDTISYLEGLQRSSNVAFSKIANEKLGFERFRDYLTRFGFDRPTGIDLPRETAGKIAFQYPIEKITTAYGQGTAITPIEQIQAVSAIANEGKMVKPYVIDKILDSNTGDVIKETKPEVTGTPISAETAKTVRDYLETVITSPKGTGYEKYNIDGYSVAGKTGTASIPNPKGGGYLDGPTNYVFSFLGMAPKDDPQLVMYVAVQQPKFEGHYGLGAIPVSNIFKTVMKNSLQYLNIKPVMEKALTKNTIPNVSGLSVQDAEAELSKLGFQVSVIGNGGNIISQQPKVDEIALQGEKVVLKTDGDSTAPNMIGWSLRDVMKVAKVTNMKLNTVGSGYAVKQNVDEGAKLTEGDFLIVEFKSPLDQLQEASNKDKKDKEDKKENQNENKKEEENHPVKD
ncbi:penicillin-binding protein [Bacillus sp. 03113]|uniref:penicillin-binding protein n=1 Tax=Bacillus sp. 03113 TaxID=2578211 RepID=UPI001141C3A2|nr:penicillin-binding protein [Bacillus sp. 03113]